MGKYEVDPDAIVYDEPHQQFIISILRHLEPILLPAEKILIDTDDDVPMAYFIKAGDLCVGYSP